MVKKYLIMTSVTNGLTQDLNPAAGMVTWLKLKKI